MRSCGRRCSWPLTIMDVIRKACGTYVTASARRSASLGVAIFPKKVMSLAASVICPAGHNLLLLSVTSGHLMLEQYSLSAFVSSTVAVASSDSIQGRSCLATLPAKMWSARRAARFHATLGFLALRCGSNHLLQVRALVLVRRSRFTLLLLALASPPDLPISHPNSRPGWLL